MMNSLTLLLALTTSVHSAAIDVRQITKRGVPQKWGWTATFNDDFIGTIGNTPSSSKWIIDTGTQYPGGDPKWGTQEVETYTRNRENIEIIAGNVLKMTPRKSKTGAWTSSRIETKRTDFAAKAGGKLLIEARLKLGNDPIVNQQGIWPAFWALGSEFRGNFHNWPLVTEWDILEVINGQTKLYSTAHCGVAPGGPCNEYVGLGSGGSNTFTREVWHTLGFKIDRSMVGAGKPGTWRDETITWYLDNREIYVLKGATLNNADAWDRLAHRSHFLLFNVAVGGDWPGPPNSRTIGGPGAGMMIDYVGVWNQ